jgi:superfamily II DNA or RNA helicase
MTNKVKDLEQNKAIAVWMQTCRGTLELCTSFGKTLTALKAAMVYIEQDPTFRVLILTPTEVIRDTTWSSEAAQWGLTEIFERNFKTECIQTARNWENTEWDMVIGDEFHNYLSPENRKFFFHNKIHKLMGLSAKIPKDKWEICRQMCPVVYRMTIQEARDLGIVSKYTICNLPVKLTPKESKKHTEINSKYAYFESVLGGKSVAFKNANYYRTRGNTQQKQAANMFFSYMRQRKDLLYNATNKLKVTNEILDLEYFKEKPAIIFTQAKKVAHALAESREDCVKYYAPDNKDKAKGLYLSKEDRSKNLTWFREGLGGISKMAAVKALNEGVSIPKISLNIIHSGTSSVKDFIQRVGRTVRLAEEGKHAYIFNLYVPNSQDQVWTENRLGEFKDDAIWLENLQELNSIVT